MNDETDSVVALHLNFSLPYGKVHPMGLAFFVLMLILPFSAALSTMLVPAVSTNGQGILTTIEARIQPGNGDVFVDVEPFISVETQLSAKVAAKQAAKAAGKNLKEYDIFYKVRANTESVDGPSGGHAMALLAYAEFTGKPLRSDLTATGTIENDGSIGRVGGILEKVEAAHGKKVGLFILPLGQRIQNGVDLTQYAQSRWNMQIAESKNLAESIPLAFSPTGSKVEIPEHIQPPLEIESVKDKMTNTEIMRNLAEKQYAKLQSGLAKVPKDSVMAQQLQQSLNLTRQLLDKGYYYSAANEAFITKIQFDAYTLSNASTADVMARINQLQEQIQNYKFSAPTKENLEWFAGAKLRWFWANKRLGELKEQADTVEQPVSLLEDFAASSNWFDAAQQLNQAALKIGGTPLNQDAFKTQSDMAIQAANQTVSTSPLDAEAIFHLTTAQDAFKTGDYITASFDASFAVAFSKARLKLVTSGDAPLAPLLPVASKLETFSDSAWSQLYFSHGLYNVAEANRSDDLSYVVNAIKLDELAQELQTNLKLLLSMNAPSALPTSSTSTQTTQSQVSVMVLPAFSNFTALLGASIVIVLAVLVALVVAYAKKPESLSKTQKLDLLEQRLLEGRISEKTFHTLTRKFKHAKKKKKH